MDAIQVCQALNLTFLWVDSLCIMQDAADELKEQIQRMDAIYSLATITIVEATSSEPRQGLECLRSRSPKQKTVCIDGFRFVLAQPRLDATLHKSEWFTRGWTYQELLLSKRLLVFTSSQVHHVCQTEAFAEDTVRPLDAKNSPQPPQLYLWNLPWLQYPDPQWSSPKSEWEWKFSCWRFYDEMLVDYGRRKLTKVADYLAAVSGILRTMGRNCNDIFLCGLPEKLFPYCLLWQPMGASHRIGTCPSWSWAGWTGAKCNPMRNAIEHGWVKRFRDTGELYKVMSALEDFSLVASDGTERWIAQQLAEEEVLRSHHSRFDERSIDKFPNHLGPDDTLIESGHLRFIADTALLTITPDQNAPPIPDSVPQLRRYRILNGENWIGTIFLGPDRGMPDGNGLNEDDAYPGELERCEFVKLTTICAKSRRQSFGGSILLGLVDYGEEWQEPKIFPTAFWHDAKLDDNDCPAKGSIDYATGGLRMHNVMWVERSGGMIFRKAVGIIAAKGVSEEQWKKETVCLH